jgi:nucleoside-diphosphate-sugar epimerase
MKTVLLTGAGGFVGRAAVRPLLDKGFEVHAVTTKDLGRSHGSLHSHQVDLLDHSAAERLISQIRPSYLLHCAWYVKHGNVWEAPENVEWLRASSLLLRSFVKHGGKRVVVSGTCAEYDWSGIEGDLSELSSPLRPATLYGRSKHELFLDLRSYAESVDLSYAWGRLFFVFGPFESEARFVPSMIRSLLKDREAECLFGENIRDLMYVNEAGSAFVELLDSEVRGPVNIASGTPQRLRDVALAIARSLDREDLLRFPSSPAGGDQPPRIAADVARLRNEVKFQETGSFEMNLRETIGWWRDNL